MKWKIHSNVEVFKTCKLEWNHLLLTGPKTNQRWGKKFDISMFIADNSIFKSIMQYFLAISIALKECYLMMNFEKDSFYRFKISVKMQI